MIIQDTKFGELWLFTKRPDENYTEEWQYFVVRERSYDGGESRDLRSTQPYREYSFNFTLEKEQKIEAFNFFTKGLRKNILIPKWIFEREITQDMVGQTFEYNDFIDSDFKNSATNPDLRIIMIKGDDVLIYNPSLINFTVTQNMVGASIMPCEVGYIVGNIQKTVHNTYTSFSIQVAITDMCLYMDGVYPQFSGYDLVTDFFLRFYGGISYDIVQQQDIQKGDFDYSRQTTTWDRPEFVKGIRYIAKDKQSIFNFMRFYASRKGSYKPFWYPYAEIYIRPLSVSGSYFTVSDPKGELASIDRENLAFFSGGSWSALKIVSKTTVLGVTTFLMDGPVGDFDFAHFLTLHRLEADRLSVSTLGGGIMEFNTSFCEMVKQP